MPADGCAVSSRPDAEFVCRFCGHKLVPDMAGSHYPGLYFYVCLRCQNWVRDGMHMRDEEKANDEN